MDGLTRDELRRLEVLCMFGEIADEQRSRVSIAIYGRHLKEQEQARQLYGLTKQQDPARHRAMLQRTKRNTLARYYSMSPEQRSAFNRENYLKAKASPARSAKRRKTARRAQAAYRARQTGKE
jgi:hypothetical protein